MTAASGEYIVSLVRSRVKKKRYETCQGCGGKIIRKDLQKKVIQLITKGVRYYVVFNLPKHVLSCVFFSKGKAREPFIYNMFDPYGA